MTRTPQRHSARTTSLSRIAVASAIFGALWATPLGAQGVVKSKHGDWQVRCETPPGASKQMCALVQSIAAEDRPNIGLIVIVLRTADGKNRSHTAADVDAVVRIR